MKPKKQKCGRKKLPNSEKLQTICIQLRPDQIRAINGIELDAVYGSLTYAARVRQVIDAGIKALDARRRP
jgi:hypothetical protein